MRTPSQWPLHALGSDVARDLERDYRKHGARAIADLRKNEPWSYLRLLLSLVPRQAPTADDSRNEMPDAEFYTLLRAAREAVALQQAAQLENADTPT